MAQLNSTIAKINNSIQKNHNVCYLQKTKLTKSLLESLYKASVVKAVQLNNKHYVVTLQTNESVGHKSALKTIKNVSTQAQKVYLSTYEIQGLSFNNRRAQYLFLTTKLITFTQEDCLLLSKGGLLAAIIRWC
jgi:ribosomal protein S8